MMIKQPQVTTVSPRQYHNTGLSALDEQMRRNGDSREFCKIAHHFVGNIDEAFIIASDRNTYVVGDVQRVKSDKSVMDGTGNTMTLQALNEKKLTARHDDPEGSKFQQ
eukprot:14217649-Ditylum_brightwellii.AAC.1